jgi:general L-amino acid transport system permease protein
MRPRSAEDPAQAPPPAAAVLNNPKFRSALYQLALVLGLAWLAYQFALNASANLGARNIASGLGFFQNTAGFGVNLSLIPFQETDTYGRAFVVGLLNTLLVSGAGIVLATLLGFTVGIGRLSSNWLVARIAGGYVEIVRNLPLLFQILFWYLAVLGTLPGPRQSLSIFGTFFLNSRGFVVPAIGLAAGFGYVWAALGFGVLATIGLGLWARRVRERTGRMIPMLWKALGLIVGLPLAAFLAAGLPVDVDVPRLQGFNFIGGTRIIPEFLALLFALTTYTASFIAEIVRAGILAVPRGQSEAGLALGLRRGQLLRLILIPQALRIIVPPLTNQYLNLTKNSSLAVAIGYPDLFAVFAGTTLNQTGQAIEIIAITMAVYLSLSLITSVLMNWYNSRLQLVER